MDCFKWNSDPSILCYECDSCKAGVLEDIRRDWRKLSVLNVIMTLLLIGIYCIGCCAFRNTQRAETNHPYGENRMSKVRPRWDFYWYVSYQSQMNSPLLRKKKETDHTKRVSLYLCFFFTSKKWIYWFTFITLQVEMVAWEKTPDLLKSGFRTYFVLFYFSTIIDQLFLLHIVLQQQ